MISLKFACIAIAAVILPAFVLFGIPRLILNWRKKRTTATVKGRVVGIDKTENYEGTNQYAGGWEISYRVKGEDYRLTQPMKAWSWGPFSGKRMQSYIEHEVTVHYDPDHPRRAWAEIP